MEFPDLGKHCSEPSCKQLDFLPVKCDACEKIFCHEHMKYASHNCESSYKKNVQVPVCPLCNIPIPSTRGQPPDISVSEHIDNQCQSDPAKNRRKTFTNKCSMKGCKTKELIPCICDKCRLNFCLKHRHAVDHRCVGRDQAQRQNAMQAALNRMNKNTNGSSVHSAAVDLQGSMSEDEALARAIQLSMQESNGPINTYDIDRQLALSLSQGQETRSRSQRQDRCLLS